MTALSGAQQNTMSETMMILKALLEVFHSVLSPSTPTVGLMETGPC